MTKEFVLDWKIPVPSALQKGQKAQKIYVDTGWALKSGPPIVSGKERFKIFFLHSECRPPID